jgi:energy-coupling factor transporter ATP-binding protein EcfA2
MHDDTRPADSRGPDLQATVERLISLADRRLALLDQHGAAAGVPSPAEPRGPRQRARELLEHSRSYLLPRARDLEAPLLVVLLGPTGSGKSTLLNTIAGTAVSETSAIRPTTRRAIVLATDEDARALLGGPLAGIPDGGLEVAAGSRPGIVVVDAPDIDSVEHANRVLADTLLEAADLSVFVTTATRYADRVPWDVLARIEQRGLPLLVVVNRLPAGPEAKQVLDDVQRLIGRTTLSGPSAASDDPAPALEIVGIDEGAVDRARQSFEPGAVDAVVDRLERLAADAAERRALTAQALAGAIRGLEPLLNQVADDLEHSAIDADALRRIAAADYADETERLIERLERGAVLRAEVLRQWHSFVGADQVTRMFAQGIGRLRGAVSTIVRGAPDAPVTAVQQGASDDVTALVVGHASDAARRVAAHWSADPGGTLLVATDAGLWSASPDLAAWTRESLDDWVRAIAAEIGATGATRKGIARGLSLSVNAAAVGVMLAVFAHTGGVTGAEVGIAAATAFLNQKLMNAVFGEAAVQRLIGAAKQGLRDRLRTVMARDRARFDALVPQGRVMRELAAELRRAAADGLEPGIG